MSNGERDVRWHPTGVTADEDVDIMKPAGQWPSSMQKDIRGSGIYLDCSFLGAEPTTKTAAPIRSVQLGNWKNT